jgi:hypothetical protein
VKITKRSILKAIRVEPLRSGSWYKKTSRGCQVCAVGAVLRREGVSPDGIERFGDILSMTGGISPGTDYATGCVAADAEDILRGELRQKKWLNALSFKFEWLCEEAYLARKKPGRLVPIHWTAMRRIRAELATWVKANLPDSFTVKEVPE